MRILVASPCMEWGYSEEAKQNGVSQMTSAPIFDMTEQEQIDRIVAAACRQGEVANIIIIDNHYVPKDVIAISPAEIDFARKMQAFNIETFFLNNRTPLSSGEFSYKRREQIRFDSELWRAFKPTKVGNARNPVPRTVKVGEFWEKLFSYKTGKAEYISGGDGGQDHAAHLVRNGFAHWDHNWPEILAAIAKELTPELVAQ